jgi:hypothetical protein
VVVSQTDPCLEEPDPGIERTASAIVEWLVGAPGVDATVPVEVSIGGLGGWMVDIAMDPGWRTSCPFSDGEPFRALFTDALPGEGFHWGLESDMRMRIWLLALPDGRALLVDVEGDASTYAAIVDEATAIVESFEFK